MKIKLIFALGLLSLLAGCAGYRSRPLNPLNPVSIKKDKNVLFAAKAFDKNDCLDYLGRDVIKAGYRPIQIAIMNESQKHFEFSHSNIDLATASPACVAEAVYQSPTARGLAYGIPGLCLLPSPLLFFLVYPNVASACVVAPGLALLIAACIDPYWAIKANKRLLEDYLVKSVNDHIVSPNTLLEGLIFVLQKDFKNQLTITLVDQDSKEEVVCEANLAN